MLLRSSSTPILGSLSSSVSHYEGDGDFHVADKISFPCASFQWFPPKSTASSAAQHMMAVCDEMSSMDGISLSSWDPDGEVVPTSNSNSNFRRAQSETDLASMGMGMGRRSSSPCSARFAAESLLQDTTSPYDDFPATYSRKHWSRRSLVQKKQLQAIPSFSFNNSGNEDEDEDDKKCDENSTLSRANNLIDSFGLLKLDDHSVKQDFSFQVCSASNLEASQNLKSPQGREICGEFVENSMHYESVRNASQKDDFKAISEAISFEGLKSNSYGGEMMQNEKATVGDSHAYDEDSHPLFLAHGLGLDGSDALLAMGGDGGKSFRNLTTGGDGGDGCSNNMEEYYERMLEMNPGNPLLLRNYAQFLFETKHDYTKAEEFYSRAILSQSGDGEVLSQYAKLIWEYHRDEKRASAYFKQAVKTSPDDCHVLAAYASFLWETDKDEEVQEDHSSYDMNNLYGVVTSAAA